MVSWYYVVGSDRVGPVTEEALKQLFFKNEITSDSYVWRKGFQNWERLKDVSELKFEKKEEKTNPAFQLPKAEDLWEAESSKAAAAIEEDTDPSPEVIFHFDWNKVRENEELFFIKIGKDRKSESDIYGPYSLIELKEAFENKRVNMQTLVFAPGMSSWTKIQDSTVNPAFKGIANPSVSLNEVPLVMVINYSPLPLVTLVKKSGVKEGILLGAGPFGDFQNKAVKASLYVGSEIKVRDVKIKVSSYDKKAQSIECEFLDLNSDAKKIMLNHAV